MADIESRKREAEAEERITKRRKTEIPKVKRYQVSNMGRVQMSGRKITPKVNKGKEYPAINIKGRYRQLAEIVLLTFGPPRPSPQHTVGHTNGKLKSDASLEGLAWHDKKEQRADQKKHKKRTTAGVKGVKAKKGGDEKEFVSIQEAARVLRLNRRSIDACLKGRRKNTGGYTFENVPALRDGEEKRPVPDHVWRDGKPVGTWYATTEGRIVSPTGAICGNEKCGRISESV